MKENTEKGTSDETEKKSELRSGALRSSLAVELHTRYAILLWEGQHTEKKEKDGRKVSHRRIMGMPYFLHLVNRINEDSLKDDPFADEKMYLLEQEFNRGTGRLERLVTELDNILKNIPARISLSEALSVSPVNISVFSRTPVGYRCVWLLVGFDQLALKAFQASHYGLISHAQRDDYLRRGAQSIHRIYGMVLGYRSSGITRRDVALWSDETLSNAQYQDVIKLMAEIDEAVLLGKSRSSYSPPVNKESVGYILAVRAANAERAERERELLSQTPALEQPTGLPESSDPAITRTDDLTR
ncbi:TIGR03761 family integrating conjugative element protein [Salmonella enterica]|nr:TIGR03761 family integrating conjugative element protein [Salmonella enterica subsp. enterica serovar Infantis]EDT7289829.1 TIGR03761 family integrating conjugative element protein [Salmonella enterica subsp. enterica]EDX8060426.1 TIGR03761 family integrating conjugative element protein [Salmonella enterica subsp. enterica serovar Java]EHU7154898.1 TIGR03761 family integrating conjugative element protein [Salmonella enterica]HCD7425049.1 TIGR03761 family integrating conjugative element prote